MTNGLAEAITAALADEFCCTPERATAWLAEHETTLPAYLRRHGLNDYADAVEIQA